MKRKSRTSAADRQIGHNIRQLRQTENLSQAELAQILGVTFQQVQKYESGSNRVSAASLYALHRHFGIPLTAFFSGLYTKAEDSVPDMKMLQLCRRIGAIADPVLKDKVARIVDILAS